MLGPSLSQYLRRLSSLDRSAEIEFEKSSCRNSKLHAAKSMADPPVSQRSSTRDQKVSLLYNPVPL
jgi:hypothetical protein